MSKKCNLMTIFTKFKLLLYNEKKGSGEIKMNRPSMAMALVKEYKKDIRILIALNAVMLIALCWSIVDSIRIRDNGVNENADKIIETINAVCGE